MLTPLDLSQLSPTQKDEVILQLQAQLLAQQEQIAALNKLLAELQSRLNLNSRNSSKPPSSDGLKKPKPKSLRKPGEKPSGGQEGHPGHTLRRVALPDKVVVHDVPAQCDACQRKLAQASVSQTRQVFDIPRPQFEVTEHRLMQVQCTCGKTHTGVFASHLTGSVQYGPNAMAAMVHLSHHHMMPVQRTAQLLGELFGMPVSQATVINACELAKKSLAPSVNAIAQALQTSPTVHADETALRVNKTQHWVHVLATSSMTWMAHHTKRGKVAFDELGVLANFHGTLIHDGWKPYRALDCAHGLCNIHHLRELTYIHEELKQDWAKDMMVLLRHANHTNNLNCADGQAPPYDAPPYRLQVEHLRYVYEQILSVGEALNPLAPPTGKRGATKQSFAANLLRRLRDYADDVWRFMSEPGVPFTNNVAEQAIRMSKVKQKISGCFRTPGGADRFCIIRSYLATMHKQGANLIDCLTQTFRGSPPQPCLA
jgi:transposase